MKGLLIFPILKDLNKADGIVVKNEGIKNGFLKNNVQLDVLEFNSKGIFNKNEKLYAFHSNKYRRVYQYHVKSWKKILDYIKKENYDFIWLRTPLIMSPVANFIAGIRKKVPSCKIILEYGYYPFEKELSKTMRIVYKLNRRNEVKAHANASFVITYAGQAKVDNLTNIPINNGIDLDDLPVVSVTTDVNKQVNLISVSSLKKWHAYERLIAGIGEYMKRGNATPVIFNIVGLGPEYEKLVQLVKELDLSAYVKFHNFKIGKELNEVYNDNHVAIGTLGFHRIGITFSSSLKNREYFGRGLPIVVSTPDEDMPASLPYVRYLPEGEEPIDVAEIVAFAKMVYGNSNVNKEIRKYAEENVSWESKIKTVLDYLKNKQ